MSEQTQAISVKARVDGLRKVLESKMDTIARTLPAQFMSPQRFSQIVVTLCAQTPKLLECQPTSLIAAVLQCATLGLSPEPATGQFYFLPFKGRVTAVPGYKGLATLAWRSQQIASLSMNVVRDGDLFDYELGSAPFLKHKPRAQLDAPVTHAYACAKPVNGEMMFEVLTTEQVRAIQARSPSAGASFSPWKSDWDAMAKKTAFRRLAKLLPLSTEPSRQLAKALDLDERAELGLAQHNEELLGESNEEEIETGQADRGATGQVAPGATRQDNSRDE